MSQSNACKYHGVVIAKFEANGSSLKTVEINYDMYFDLNQKPIVINIFKRDITHTDRGL